MEIDYRDMANMSPAPDRAVIVMGSGMKVVGHIRPAVLCAVVQNETSVVFMPSIHRMNQIEAVGKIVVGMDDFSKAVSDAITQYFG